MALLFDVTESKEITEFVGLEKTQDVTKVENTALDGTYYQQIIGSPREIYNVTAYVDRAGKDTLMTADANGNLLRVDAKHGTYYGRITGKPRYGDRLAQDYFKVTMTLARVEI